MDMILFWLYGSVFIAALLWVAVDRYSTGTFEFFSKNLHECARAMGMYSKWVRHTLGRLALLSLLIAISVVTAVRVFAVNPLELSLSGQWLLLASMLVGTVILVPLPQIADRLRFLRMIYSKTAALTNQFSLGNWQPEMQDQWDNADYETSQSWTAWHPRLEDFEHDHVWSDLVPVIYLQQGTEESIVVPSNWEYFLAWKWPGDTRINAPLPFTGPGNTRFFMKSLRQIPGRPGWLLVRAEMEDFELESIAA
jgi:hypothetical protein